MEAPKNQHDVISVLVANVKASGTEDDSLPDDHDRENQEVVLHK